MGQSRPKHWHIQIQQHTTQSIKFQLTLKSYQKREQSLKKVLKRLEVIF